MVAGLAPTPRGGAVFFAAISAGLLKPIGCLSSTNSASSPPPRRGLTEEQRLAPRWALSNVGPVFSRRAYYGEGDARRPNRMVAEEYERNGGPPLLQEQQQSGPFLRASAILWEKHLSNTVRLMGLVGRDVEIDSDKVVDTTSLPVHEGSQRSKDPSWFTLEICDDLAEVAPHHVAKGELILVAGQIMLDKRIKDDIRSTLVKVLVREICFLKPASDRRQPFGQSHDEIMVRGSSSQFQAEVASVNRSQRNWTSRQLSSQLAHGPAGYGNNVPRLETQSAQTRARASSWRKTATMIQQNRNPSPKVVGGTESSQQNTDSLKLELERVGSMKTNLSDNLVRKAHWMDGRPTLEWTNAGFNRTGPGGWQSRATYGSRDWSRNSETGNCSKDIHSARTTSQAIAVLKTRIQQGITTGKNTYVKVLQMCSKQKDVLAAKQVHDCIIESGMDKNAYVAGTLLNVYIKCGEMLDARRVFDKIENKTLIDWTSMIAGYAKNDNPASAFELFNLMRQESARPNAVTYICVLKACTSPSALKWGKEIHEYIRQAGFESDVRVGTALVHMYAQCGCITEARRVFEKVTHRNVIAWTAMIGGLAQYGYGHEAYRLFLQMRREGFEPNPVTYASILNASASAGALDWVKKVHAHAIEAELESDLLVGSSLVHMYAKCGSIDDGKLVFDRMDKADVVTWNIMIGGLAQHGNAHEALELFRKMNGDHVKPNESSFVAVLSACSHGGLVDDGRRIFSAMKQDYGIEPDVVHYTCMVDLLGRAGRVEEAKQFMSDMPIEPNAVTWRTLLGACRTYGNVELGELAANKLFELEPDRASTYVLLSNIYAATGKWEKVSAVRTMMQERRVRKEPGRSWVEVDNKIHEFVVGDTSHPEAEAIYTELNKLSEKLKAEGYIPDTRLVLHDINEEDKELALCSHSEKLAIAYGLMHVPQGEPIRVSKNLRVCSDCHSATKYISKVTGREIIARDASRFHRFKDGVCSCGDYW